MYTREAAKYLGISYQYLRNMRHEMYSHDGPEYMVEDHPKGKAYVYTEEGLNEWRRKHEWKRDKERQPRKNKTREEISFGFLHQGECDYVDDGLDVSDLEELELA